MAEQSMFIERLDGGLVNISLLQSVYVDPFDLTNVIWLMRNGQIYTEDLATNTEATNRYNYLKGLLLGTTIAELEKKIAEQQTTVVEQTKTITETNTQIDSLNTLATEINGEDA